MTLSISCPLIATDLGEMQQRLQRQMASRYRCHKLPHRIDQRQHVKYYRYAAHRW